MFNPFVQNLLIKDHFSYPDFVRFNANRCNVCAILHKVHKSVIQKSPSKSCGGCKLISYCGVEHQKLDWPMHKDFCKAVQCFLKDSKLEHPLDDHTDPIKSKKDLKQRALMLGKLLTIVLGHDLKIYELDLLFFPRICGNCFTFKISNHWNCSISDNSEGGMSSNSNDNGCKLISYCSRQCKISHQAEHEKNCKNLQIATNFWCEDILPIQNLKLIVKKIFKLNMKNQTNLIDVLEKFINIKIPKIPKNIEEFRKFFSASIFNYVMTLSYVIDFCNILKNLKINDHLTIYIIGGSAELFRRSYIHFQNDYLLFLISQMPSVKKLSLIFVSEFMEDTTQVKEINYKGRKYEIELSFIQESFNDFVEHPVIKTFMFGPRSPFFPFTKMDLILSFDCGFSKSSNYFESFHNISKIFRIANVPIAFTSRTLGEANEDWNVVRETAIDMDITFEILMKTKENQFKEIVPIRNLYPNDEEICFVNNYLSIIKVNI